MPRVQDTGPNAYSSRARRHYLLAYRRLFTDQFDLRDLHEVLALAAEGREHDLVVRVSDVIVERNQRLVLRARYPARRKAARSHCLVRR